MTAPIFVRAPIIIDPRTDALLITDVQAAFLAGGGLAVADGEAVIPPILRVARLFSGSIYVSIDRHPRGHISLASSYVGLPSMTLLTPELAEARFRAAETGVAPDAEFSVDAGWKILEAETFALIAKPVSFHSVTLREYLRSVGAQMLWPDHAVEGSGEDELHPSLRHLGIRHTLIKGTDPRCDSYSPFRDNLKRSTGLGERMQTDGITRVFNCGLAEDFCVGYGSLNAVEFGFASYVIANATRPVNVPPMNGRPGTLEKIRKDFKDAGVEYVDSADLRAAA